MSAVNPEKNVPRKVEEGELPCVQILLPLLGIHNTQPCKVIRTFPVAYCRLMHVTGNPLGRLSTPRCREGGQHALRWASTPKAP